MEHIIKTHLWLANLFFLSSILMTSYWMIKRHKANILSLMPGRIFYISEMIFSGLVPAMGIWLLIRQSIWLRFPSFRIKLLTAIAAIALIHIANSKMRKYIRTGKINPVIITYLRIAALILLLVTYNYGLNLLNYASM